MPTPKLDPIPLPVDMGLSAQEYLEHHGLVASVPTIRSSDYGLALKTPRLYYLIRRLGLVPAMRWSEAMNRGSWFHVLLYLYKAPNRYSLYDNILNARLDELRDICKTFDIKGEQEEAIIQREQKDAYTARAWFEALDFVPIRRESTGETFTIREYLSRPDWVDLGGEIRIARPWQDTSLVIQLDRLLYSRKANKLWIFDGKTHAETDNQGNPSCLKRMSTVKHEFQTKHYMVNTQWALENGLLHAQFHDLPDDVKFGGMIHIPVWKPKLVFGMKDRPYQWQSSGKRKNMEGAIIRAPGSDDSYNVVIKTIDAPGVVGETGDVCFTGPLSEAKETMHEVTGKKPDKVFVGEPSLERFVERIKEVYRAEGDYEHLAEGFKTDPPVNMHHTSAVMLLDNEWLTEYWDCVQYIYSHATRPATPDNFLPPDMHDARGGEYAPFFINPVSKWPEIIAQNHFITQRRDGDIEGELDARRIDVNQE